MPLIDEAEKAPEKYADYTVQQIVTICGDGKLRDASACSNQFRKFLVSQTSLKLSEYSKYCLDVKFEGSGFVLQDVVNEIGRRLGYGVANGLYRGRSDEIGFDGRWSHGQIELVVEVKTTDAYRINLDTVTGYAAKLIGPTAGSASKSINCLIVVGRQDTGDLEAQVRGSRHAWSTRLISVDALIKLMFVAEEVDDSALVGKITKILLPFEYTRVDHIVDLVFETQQVTETKTQIEEADDDVVRLPPSRLPQDFTPGNLIAQKREKAVRAFFLARRAEPVQISRAKFSDQDGKTRVICAVSKRYKRESQPYWYALHPQWLDFMQEAEEGFFILCGMDIDVGFAIPIVDLRKWLEGLNRTETADRYYWHIVLTQENDTTFLNMSKIGQKISLRPYEFSFVV